MVAKLPRTNLILLYFILPDLFNIRLRSIVESCKPVHYWRILFDFAPVRTRSISKSFAPVAALQTNFTPVRTSSISRQFHTSCCSSIGATTIFIVTSPSLRRTRASVRYTPHFIHTQLLNRSITHSSWAPLQPYFHLFLSHFFILVLFNFCIPFLCAIRLSVLLSLLLLCSFLLKFLLFYLSVFIIAFSFL